MDQLIATARNIRVFLKEESDEEDKDKGVVPEIELVLTTMERSFQFSGASLANIESTKTLRFSVTPEGARKFAESLQEWADDADSKTETLREALKDLKNGS